MPLRKEKTSSRRRSTRMSSRIPKDIDDYLSRVPEPARTALDKLRATIRAAAPAEATEAITYGIPTFKYNGSLVAFAAFSHHCSLFPMSLSVIEKFKSDLKDFEVSKGTIRFTPDSPLPASLVKKIVAARIGQQKLKKRR
jgi:uncharacterized protein YdhG (YjbR/CyaY superfamily)